MIETLRRGARDIFGMLFVIMMVMVIYVQAGSILFSSHFLQFTSFVHSLLYMFNMVLGEYDYGDLEATHRILAPLFFFTFQLLMMYLIVNLFICVINISFEAARADIKPNKYELLDFLQRSAKSYLPLALKRSLRTTQMGEKGSCEVVAMSSGYEKMVEEKCEKMVDKDDCQEFADDGLDDEMYLITRKTKSRRRRRWNIETGSTITIDRADSAMSVKVIQDNSRTHIRPETTPERTRSSEQTSQHRAASASQHRAITSNTNYSTEEMEMMERISRMEHQTNTKKQTSQNISFNSTADEDDFLMEIKGIRNVQKRRQTRHYISDLDSNEPHVDTNNEFIDAQLVETLNKLDRFSILELNDDDLENRFIAFLSENIKFPKPNTLKIPNAGFKNLVGRVIAKNRQQRIAEALYHKTKLEIFTPPEKITAPLTEVLARQISVKTPSETPDLPLQRSTPSRTLPKTPDPPSRGSTPGRLLPATPQSPWPEPLKPTLPPLEVEISPIQIEEDPPLIPELPATRPADLPPVKQAPKAWSIDPFSISGISQMNKQLKKRRLVSITEDLRLHGVDNKKAVNEQTTVKAKWKLAHSKNTDQPTKLHGGEEDKYS